MSRQAVRGQVWSMRQAWLAAGVSEAQARAVVRSGVLGDISQGFQFADVVALRVAVLVGSAVFPGEVRPANTSRQVLPRQAEAVARARTVAREGLTGAVLLVAPTQVVLSLSPSDLAAYVLAASDPYVSLPVGAWVAQLLAEGDEGAA